MASRGLGARVVQKKLHKITKELLKRDEIQCLLSDAVEQVSAIKFLVEPDFIDQYEDDVFSYKRDAEECFRLFSQLRGKKREYAGLVNFFTALMEENFPGVFDGASVEAISESVVTTASARKRGRQEVEEQEETQPEVKRNPSRTKQTEVDNEVPNSTENKLTYNEKNALRSIITKLMKNPVAEPFLYPVDRKEYPEYYRIVKRPMDLETVRSNINDYSTLHEALGDLRLIWENCRQFNEEGSDIIGATFSMGDALEEMVEEKFGEEFVVRKKDKTKRKDKALVKEELVEEQEKPVVVSSGRKKRISDLSEAVLSSGASLLTKGEMKQLLKEMATCEFAAPFVSAVDLTVAPGYLRVVHTPMAIDTMRSNTKAGLYESDPSLFVAHMRLISTNCLLYNDSESDIARWAQQFAGIFEDKLIKLGGSFETSTAPRKGRGMEDTSVKQENFDVQMTTDLESGVIRIPRKSLGNGGGGKRVRVDSEVAAEVLDVDEKSTLPRVPLSITIRKLKKIFKEVHNHELSPPFHLPINLSLAPGYSTVVKLPMDLSTVKAQLTSYEDAPGKFLGDMRLIFDNCQLYNQEESALYQAAGTLRSLTDALFMEYFPPEVATVKASRGGARTKSIEGKVEDATGKGSAKNEQLADGQSSAPSAKIPSDSAPTTSARAAKLLPALPRPQTLAGIEELVNQLSDASLIKGHNKFVREKASRVAIELLRATRLPFVVVPTLYEVTHFGEVHPDIVAHDERHIFPINYTVGRTLRICVTPTEGTSTGQAVFIPVELKSTIVSSSASEKGCSFLVTLQNGTVVSRGSSPRLAWEAALDKAEATARSLASKVERCRSVFNRLCMSPDSTPFLEKVPSIGEDGADYYRVITAPMWLREVHSRLVSGTYDNEFDFAWDVRLVFRNCMEYNASSSALHHTAQRASLIFEHLFVNWVVNVQDRSVDEVAVGAWNDWKHIRYFDSPNPEENVCVSTGQHGLESDMVQCQWCEDQYLRTVVQVDAKNKWACARCTSAWEVIKSNPNGEPLPLLSLKFCEVPYSCEEFGGSVFVPSTDLGTGWCQARRKIRGGLKNIFLSPLGYEVNSREDVTMQDAYEKTINQELLTARSKEYQESLVVVNKSTTVGKGKVTTKRSRTMRHTRRTRSVQSTSDSVKDEEQEDRAEETSSGSDKVSVPVDADEEGCMTLGKLCRYVSPEGARLAWFSCADESAVLSAIRRHEDPSHLLGTLSELSTANMAEDGFFGLTLPEIRARMEGLEHVNSCSMYVFQDSDSLGEELLEELQYERDKYSALTDGETRLKRTLLNERWHWEMVRLDPWSLAPSFETTNAHVVRDAEVGKEGCMDVDTSSELIVFAPLAAVHREGFTQLFPDAVTASQADALLSLWDFFDAAKSLIGTPTFTLMDLTRSLEKPSNLLPTFGQVVFDEACCMIAELLLIETRVRADMNPEQEREWQDVLMVKPINIITWPQVALEAIRILSCPFSPVEVQELVSKPAVSKELTDQNDILVLLFAHPAIDVFLSSNNSHYVWVSDSTKAVVTKTLGVILGVRDSFCRSMGICVIQEEGEFKEGPSTAAMCVHLRSSFVDVSRSTDIDLLFVMAANELLVWFDDLVINFGIVVPLTDNAPVVTSVANETFATSKARSAMNYKRFWGSYLLSNSETAREQIMTPLSFTNYRGMGDYAIKLSALHAMQRTVLLLRGSEPDSFSTDDRVAVYSALVDMGSMVKQLTNLARSKHSRLRSALGEYHEMQTLPTSTAPLLQPTKGTVAKCHFTGISMRNTFEALRWNALPSEYEALPVVLELQKALNKSCADSSSNQVQSVVGAVSLENGVGKTLVAVQTALLRVVAAREAATREKVKYEEYIATQLDGLTKPAQAFRSTAEVDSSRPLGYRSLPVGFDRYGNSYWVLSAQEIMTLFPYGTNGTAAIAATKGMVPMEPCVLLREPNGWWGYHHGHDLHKLMNSFSLEIVCERILRDCLIDRLSFARRLLLSSTLRIKSAQQEWIDRRIRSERWTSQVRLSEDFTVAQTIRLIEVVWARCVEVRMYIHYAGIYRREDDANNKTSVRAERDAVARRQKRIRETLQDDTFDHHPIKGWVRLDILTRLRELAATTTATRIHADSTVYGIINHNLRHSIFHRREQPQSLAIGFPVQLVVSAVELSAKMDTVSIASVAVINQVTVGDKVLEKEDTVSMKTVSDISPSISHSDALQEEMEDFAHLAEALSDHPSQLEQEVPQSSPMEVASPAEVTVDAEVETDELGVTEGMAKSSAGFIDISVMNQQREEEMDVDELLLEQEHARLQGVAENSDRYDPEIEAALEMSYNNTKKMLPVEQLHITTGEVLRVYPRGKDAALFMNVSQSGISLCCSGSKADCYGFRWRMYEGPPIDFDAIKDRQTPWEDLKRMQIMRGKHVEFNPEEEQERIRRGLIGAIGTPKKTYNTKNNSGVTQTTTAGVDVNQDRIVRSAAKVALESITQTLVPKTTQLPLPTTVVRPGVAQLTSFVNSSLQSVTANKFQPILTTSSVLVSGRMLRLKAELLNMFYIVPEKQFKWPEPDEKGQRAIDAAGNAAADTVFTTAARMSAGEQAVTPAVGPADDDDEDAPVNVGGMDLSRANVDKLADKASRKAKRRLKRRLAIDQFVNGVLNATTSQELMDSVLSFEDALPLSLLFTYPRQMLPIVGNSLASVAMRLYTIDRALRYDDMKGAEIQSATCTYKLRTQFAPRCLLSASCTRFLCHGGKCSNFTDTASRVPDIFDVQQQNQQQNSASVMSTARPLGQQFPLQDRINRYPGMGAGGFVGHAQSIGANSCLMNSIGAYRRPFETQGLTGGQYQQMGQYRDEYEMPERERKPEKIVVDIENIQPYVPVAHEVSIVEWI